MSYVSLSNIISNQNDKDKRATVNYVDNQIKNTFNILAANNLIGEGLKVNNGKIESVYKDSFDRIVVEDYYIYNKAIGGNYNHYIANYKYNNDFVYYSTGSLKLANLLGNQGSPYRHNTILLTDISPYMLDFDAQTVNTLCFYYLYNKNKLNSDSLFYINGLIHGGFNFKDYQGNFNSFLDLNSAFKNTLSFLDSPYCRSLSTIGWMNNYGINEYLTEMPTLNYVIKADNFYREILNKAPNLKNRNIAVIGPSMIDISNAYTFTSIREPACHDKVINMFYAYCNCQYINCSPKSGNNVVDMYAAYSRCNRLTGPAVCGPSVRNFSRCYEMCNNLTGTPVCGDKVIDFSSAYEYCSGLTGDAVCGNNVVNMDGTYAQCYNLNGNAYIGENVINANRAFSSCSNIVKAIFYGNKVENFYATFSSCRNLQQTPVLPGNNVINCAWMYCYCNQLLGGNCFIYAKNIANAQAFINGTNFVKTGRLNIYVLNDTTTNSSFNSLIINRSQDNGTYIDVSLNSSSSNVWLYRINSLEEMKALDKVNFPNGI